MGSDAQLVPLAKTNTIVEKRQLYEHSVDDR